MNGGPVLIPAALLVVGFALAVAGLALVSVPAALVVAGVSLVAVALYVDFDDLKPKGRRRGATR